MPNTKKKKQIVINPTAKAATTVASVTVPVVPGSGIAPPAGGLIPSTPPSTGDVGNGSSTTALSTTPPTVTLPAIPSGFAPIPLKVYRGAHPMAAEVQAAPNAAAELVASTTYSETFGSAVPAAPVVAAHVTTGVAWTHIRVDVENFLVYVKTLEAIVWKTALSDLDKLNAVFQVVSAQNPAVLAEFPSLTALFNVRKDTGARAAASRARDAKAKKSAAATASAPAATPAPPQTPSTPTAGGTSH